MLSRARSGAALASGMIAADELIGHHASGWEAVLR